MADFGCFTKNKNIGAQSPGEETWGGGGGCDGQLEGGKERRGMEGWREKNRNFPCWSPSVAT